MRALACVCIVRTQRQRKDEIERERARLKAAGKPYRLDMVAPGDAAELIAEAKSKASAPSTPASGEQHH